MTKTPKQELDEWNVLPAIFANRFVVLADPEQVRIIFADQITDGEPKPRCSLVIRSPDAEQLAETIVRTLKTARDAAAAPTLEPGLDFSAGTVFEAPETYI